MITPPPFISLLSIYTLFFKIGAFSFGGGLTGWVYREVVVARHWMEEEDFLSGLALSQIVPGANIANLCIFVGNRLRGTMGAAAALIGLLSAPFFIVIGLLSIYETIAAIGWIRAALDGTAAAAVGLLVLMAWRSGRKTGGRWSSIAVMAATFIAVGVMRWPLVWVVLVLAPISVALAWPRKDENAGG
ncbi:chromate transporter [Lacibacterium aquatile]|uniref:Chromate transporter n=1 Tax=Lacibacterium aquatile TaxID=1168082 RepID=A0ABW5DVB1_9PROT